MTSELGDDLNQIREQRKKELIAQNNSASSVTPKNVVEIQSIKEFQDLVNTYKDNLIIVDFWAEWCGPCKAFAPVFKELQHKFQDRVIFAKLNVDNIPEIPAQFGIDGIPTSLFIRQKTIIHAQVGALPQAAFAQVIEKVLKAK